jgi:hypothetical protein
MTGVPRKAGAQVAPRTGYRARGPVARGERLTCQPNARVEGP